MSFSFSLYYVKTSAPAEAVRAVYGSVEEAGAGWLAYDLGDSPPAAALGEGFGSKEPSARFGEAIYLWGDTSSDELWYDHARDGALVRKLRWTNDGEQCSWEQVEGEPEEWEDQLFGARALEDALGLVEPEEEEEVRAIFAGRRIQAGARWPSGAPGVATLIERHFGLTRPQRRRR